MKTITIDRYIASILFLLLLLSILSTINLININPQILSLSIIGLSAYLLLSILMVNGFLFVQIKMFLPYIIFVSIYIFNLIANPTQSAVNNIIFFIAYASFLFVIMNINWKKHHLKLLKLISYFCLTILLFILVFDFNIDVNPNRVGVIAFVLSFFPLLYIMSYAKRFKSIRLLTFIGFSATIILISGARSVLLSIGFILITYIVWKLISKNKKLFKLFFWTVTGIMFVYTVIYPKLVTLLPNFNYYEQLMIEYTGKSIHSGRNVLWNIILDSVSQKPILGYGSGTLMSDFLDTDHSTHNLYLTITLQVGVLGLIFFILFLNKIWNVFWTNRFDKKVLLGASFFIGILTLQLHEDLLIVSSTAINFSMWLIIGIGLSYCFHKNNNPSKS